MFLPPTQIDQIKPVILVNNEFEYREKLKSNCFFLEFSDYPDSDARQKDNEFLVELSSASAVFSTDFDGGNRTGGG